jgi:YD repeat-containing protein
MRLGRRGARRGWLRRPSFRSLLCSILFVAALLPAAPIALGEGKDPGNEVVVVPPPPPPPVLSGSLRQQVDPSGAAQPLLDPPVSTFDLGTDPTEAIKSLIEDAKANDANTNVFQINGTDHLLQVFAKPVNYQDKDGNWTPISTDLVSDGKGGLQNSANAFTTDFPEKLSTSTPVVVTLPKGSFSFSLEGSVGSSIVQVDPSTLAYTGVLDGVDLTYTATALGYLETLTLASADAAKSLVFDLSSSDLTFRLEKTGEISILSGEDVVATVPAPSALDSSDVPATGAASYALTDLGGGSYTLGLTVDQAFLDAAKYPVTVDPPTVTLYPAKDAYVDEAYPDTSYTTSTVLLVGNPGSGIRNPFVEFGLSSYKLANRTVISGHTYLWATAVGSGPTDDVKARQVLDSWTSPTYNNQPSVNTNVIAAEASGSVNTWYDFNTTDFNQNIIDLTIGTANDGLRFGTTSGSNNTRTFASSETTLSGAQPQLVLYYNDPPPAPTLAYPLDAKVFSYSSPTLSITSIPTDNNGDDVDVNYQISETSDFASITVSSGWIADKNWTVPAGNLLDGKAYYWRVQSWDVCGPGDNDMCQMMGRDHFASGSRTFTLALDHYGMETNWPMWTDHLGNGMTLAVNEASGNLNLSYPLDSIPTPVGNLDLGLAYNHQDGADNGLGQGWWISAGPASDPRELPSKLIDVDNGDAKKIILRDGDEQYFSKVQDASTNIYSGSGSATVLKNGDGTYLYSTASGGQYTFSSSGTLVSASPATNTSTTKTFSYVFSSNGHLQTITDPMGRVITLTWITNDTKLQKIVTWDSREWDFAYDPTLTDMIKTVTDPEGGVVTFGYNATPRRLTSVTDGAGYQTSVVYGSIPQGVPKAQVANVTDAGYGSADRTEFVYNGPYTGQVAAQAIVHDPRWNSPSTSFTTTTDINTAGLPIRISGPGNNLGFLPVTSMVWDKNGNLICKRAPAANAVDSTKCTATDSNPDSMQTDYAYDTEAPYRELTETGPDPDGAGPLGRPVTSYAYDEGITGIFRQAYPNGSFTGIPQDERVTNTVNNAWGNDGPFSSPEDHFSVRWTGRLYVSTVHTYQFKLYADDGSVLVVGKTVLDDCLQATQAYGYNCGSGAVVKKKLFPGYHDLTVEYQEQTGTAHVELWWDSGTNGATFSLVPTASLTPNLGLVTTKTDPLGTTTYAYSDDIYQVRHLPSSVTRSNAQTTARTTSYTYDSYGRTLTEQNAAGTITNTYAADATLLDCLATMVDRANAETDHTCDPAGDVLTTTQVIAAVDQQPAQSRVTTKTYDKLGKLKTVQATDGVFTRTVTNTYDGSGRLTQSSDYSNGSTRLTTYDYDTHGRLWHQTLPDPDGGGAARLPGHDPRL